jgi:hypothetical protein
MSAHFESNLFDSIARNIGVDGGLFGLHDTLLFPSVVIE